jgi:hypothetical protein
VPRATDATPGLTAKPYGGIQKSKKKQKNMTKGQRRRHEKDVARAEAVQAQLSKRVDDSKVRLKKVRERRSMWEELNGKTTFGNLDNIIDADGVEVDDDSAWVDEAMEEFDANQNGLKTLEGVRVPLEAAATKLVVVDRTASALTKGTKDDAEHIT